MRLTHAIHPSRWHILTAERGTATFPA